MPGDGPRLGPLWALGNVAPRVAHSAWVAPTATVVGAARRDRDAIKEIVVGGVYVTPRNTWSSSAASR